MARVKVYTFTKPDKRKRAGSTFKRTEASKSRRRS